MRTFITYVSLPRTEPERGLRPLFGRSAASLLLLEEARIFARPPRNGVAVLAVLWGCTHPT
jgi:hypothetical protein